MSTRLTCPPIRARLLPMSVGDAACADYHAPVYNSHAPPDRTANGRGNRSRDSVAVRYTPAFDRSARLFCLPIR